MIEERILCFNAKSKQPPQHILFYRDGVSESQYGMVIADEIPRIKAGCISAGKKLKLGDNWTPHLTLLIVGKRHHTRFFPIKDDRNGVKDTKNLQAGLVID